MANDSDKTGNFEEMVLAKIRDCSKQYDWDNESRIRKAVTLEYRDRGNYFGVFNTKAGRQLEFVGQIGKGLVTYPVVPRAFRSKAATSLATMPNFTVEPIRKIPEMEAAAEIADEILKQFDRKHWTDEFELQSSHLRMTQRWHVIELTKDENLGYTYQATESEEPTEVQVAGREFACGNCGFAAFEDDMMTEEPEAVEATELPEEIEHASMMPPELGEQLGEEMNEADEALELPIPNDSYSCPKCVEGVMRPIAAPVMQTRQKLATIDKKTGKFSVEIRSNFTCRIDDYSSIGGRFDKARWFNVNDLLPSEHCKHSYPKKKDKFSSQSFEKWSTGSHWHYALSKENGNYHNAVSAEYKTGLSQFQELQTWYFQPSECHGWKSPGEWKLITQENTKTDDGEVENADFTFQKDETIEMAIKRNAADKGLDDDAQDFKGLCVVVCNDQVVEIRNEDFRTKFDVCHWTVNPTNFHGNGEERLLHLQDAATNIFSMIYSAGMQHQFAALVVNGNYFDENQIDRNNVGGIIYAKKDTGEDMSKVNFAQHIFYLSPPSMDPLIMELANLIIEIQKEESGISDEVVGNPNPQNQTASGRQTAVNQALGLSLSPSKAKAFAKKRIFIKYLKAWQFQPDQAFREIKGTFNEEWKTADIEAFRNLEIDLDIDVKLVEGSDAPRAMGSQGDILTLVAQSGILSPDSGLPADFVTKLLRAMNVDYDFNNAAAMERLANKRLNLLKRTLAEVKKVPGYSLEAAVPTVQIPIIDPNTGQPAIDPETGQPLTNSVKQINPDLLAEVTSDPRLQPQPTDNHQVFLEVLIDEISGQLGNDKPDWLYLAFLAEARTATMAMMNDVLQEQAVSQANISGAASGAEQNTVNQQTGTADAETAKADAETAKAESDMAFKAEQADKDWAMKLREQTLKVAPPKSKGERDDYE
jgi:hypothetical protein